MMVSSLNNLRFLKADIIPFNGRGHTKEGLEKIVSFGYTPKIVNQEKF